MSAGRGGYGAGMGDTMAGSGAGGRWSTGLLVAAVTVVAPLALLGWQFWLVAPPLAAPPSVPTPMVGVADTATPEAVDVADTRPAEPVVESVAWSPPVAVPPPLPTPLPTPVPTPTPRDVWSGESAFNFIAVGIDRRNDEEIPRTDTIMVGSVDLVRPRFSLMSIPRDLLLEIPGYGYDRINAAFVYGEQFEGPDGGIGLLRRTIEWNFGIPIHHFGMIDFGCFRTAVDALGGVTVDVPRAIVDTQYPTDDYGYMTVRFDPGLQWLDGDRALQYARTRHADNDLQRMRRQQQIVAAVRQELLQFRTLTFLPTIVNGCRNLRSDLGLRDYVGLATTLRQLGDAEVTMRAIDDDMVAEGYTRTGAAVLFPRWEPIQALVRDHFRAGRSATTVKATTPDSDARSARQAREREPRAERQREPRRGG